MTLSRPPGFRSSVAERSISFRASISWFTSMRSAWKSFAMSFFSRSRLKRGSTAVMKSLVVRMGFSALALTSAEAMRREFFSSPYR